MAPDLRIKRLAAFAATAILLTACASVSPTPPQTGSSPSPALFATATYTAAATAAPVPAISIFQPSPQLSAQPTATTAPPSNATQTAAPTPGSTQPPATASLEPTPGAWAGPEQVSNRQYDHLAMVLDADGFVHAAATIGPDVWYLTNKGGSWTRELIDSPPAREKDDGPQIALDPVDGSLSIVFSRRSTVTAPNFSLGGYFATNRGGAWSAPALVLDGSEEPHVAAGHGSDYFAYYDNNAPNAENLEDIARPMYQAGFDATPTPLADTGVALGIQVLDDGTVDVLYTSWKPGRETRARVFVREIRPTGEIVDSVEPTSAVEGYASGGFGASGDPFVNWPGEGDSLFAFVRNGEWTQPQELVGLLFAVDATGLGHGLSPPDRFRPDGTAGTVSYWQNDGHDFSAKRDLLEVQTLNDLALALDAAQRPHVLISADTGLWYAVGPRG